jgi:CubicO group peptidase (beta-lactamase class C family)
MKHIIFISLALGLVRPTFAQNMTARLDSVMTAFHRVQHFNGSVLVAENGQVLLHKGYGLKSFSRQTPNDEQTVFMIASITKQFTAAVILQLAAQKKLSLTDPLDKYFPGFPDGARITIYHLLTHTSGVPDYTQDSTFMKDVVHRSAKPLAVSEALVQYHKADFAPGADWKYSNQGYQLLGEIIAKLTKMTYFQAVRKYIFQPLHMTRSGFDFAGLKDSDKSTGYWTYPENGKDEEATTIDSALSYSAGSIYSTTGDLYKWSEGLQQHKIVSKDLLDKSYTPARNHYGLGWFIDSLFGKRVLSHSGDTWGFKTNIARVTADDVCIVLLNNIEDEEMRGDLTNSLLAALYGRPYTLPVYRQEIKVDEDTLKKYVGTYEFSPQVSVAILLDEDGLWIQPKGQPKSRLYAEKNDYFFSKVVDGQAEFIRNTDGKTASLILHQGGQQMVGKRVD